MGTSDVSAGRVTGAEHWTSKGDVRLFLWEKYLGSREGKPAILFVHGSSMSSQPTFDLSVPGRPDSSVMDWFAKRGFVCWCVDMEGYGRSDKRRDIYCDIANGADDLAAATDYIAKSSGIAAFCTYGISSGALRAALFAQMHPGASPPLALDFQRTGISVSTLEQRRKKLPHFLAHKRRPIDRAFVHSSFERDPPDTAEARVIDAFADAILALDDSMPNGTYIDMCSKLPIVDPERISAPTLVLRGEYDGIAAFDDVLQFFERLPNPDKQFTVMAGISHASFQREELPDGLTTSCRRSSRSGSGLCGNAAQLNRCAAIAQARHSKPLCAVRAAENLPPDSRQPDDPHWQCAQRGAARGWRIRSSGKTRRAAERDRK
jgi:pimeloyl-ACP methyl ester carboxylesterase